MPGEPGNITLEPLLLLLFWIFLFLFIVEVAWVETGYDSFSSHYHSKAMLKGSVQKWINYGQGRNL